MYKLVVISGPNRGTSFALQGTGLTVGRQSGNSVVLPSAKVSKQHCSLTLEAGQVVLKDLGSSNGTFVNGVLAKIKKLKTGDRISVGEYVLELAEAVKKPVRPSVPVGGIRNQVQIGQGMNPFTQTGTTFDGLPGAGASGVGSSDLNQNFGMGTNEPPKDLKGKAIWFFETRFMPLFYNLNLKHEWQMICIVVVAAFVLGNLAISVYPLMQANRESLIKETARRARFMARQIADNNSGYLAARAETKTEVGSIENAEGVRTALLVDLDNRIIAPSSKMNQYLTAGHEATFAVKARDNFRAGKETGTWQENEDLVIAIEPVKVMSAAAGRNIVVAMAIVSLDSTLAIPDMGEMGMVYSETFIMTALLAALLFLILYKLTLKPFMALNEDMDKALKGDLTQVSHHYKFSELNALWDIINSAIQRIPRGGESSGGFGSATLSSPSEEFSGPLKMIGNLVPFGFVILDADKKILYLNSIFEEASGIRSDSSLGSPIADVARDQSMGPFIEDLFNRAPVGGEGITEDYELSGISYKVHGASFGMPGGTAKCLVMAVVKLDV